MRSQSRDFVRVIRDVLMGATPTPETEGDLAALDSDKTVRRFGYSVFALVFLGLGTWAGCAPMETAAIGAGSVQVEGDSKVIQHLEGGIVSEILISSGDYVQKNQALVQFDRTQLNAQLSIEQGQYWSRRATLDRLISERDRLQSISFSQWLVEVSDERAQTAIANEKTLFKARLADRETEAAVLRQQANIYQSQAKGVEAALNSRREVAFSLEEETSDLKALLQDGYVDKQRLRQLERTLANTLGEISELEEKAAGTRVAIDEAQLRAVQLDKRFIKEVVDEITVVQEQVYDVKQRINVITDKLERTMVKTPIAGIVVEVKPNTMGAVLGPGQDLVTIVPDSDRLIVDVHLSPMDIDRLIVGQEAEVRFSVFKDAYTITGTLVKLSADSVQDEVTGETIFRGKVRLHENDINLLGDEKLVPGMPAEVMIKTGTSTFLSYITSPLARIMDNSLIED